MQCVHCPNEGTHRTMQTKPGTLGPLFDVWYCDECYHKEEERWEEHNC